MHFTSGCRYCTSRRALLGWLQRLTQLRKRPGTPIVRFSRRRMRDHLLLLRGNQADSLLGCSSSTKLIFRFNFAFFFITTKAQVKLFTEEEAWFEIAGGCHHHVSRSAISFPLFSIPLYAPYRIMTPCIWIHYSKVSVRMTRLISSPFTSIPFEWVFFSYSHYF